MAIVLKTRYNAIEDKILEYIQGMDDWDATNSQKGMRGYPSTGPPWLFILEDPIDSPPADLGGHARVTMQFTIFIRVDDDTMTGDSSVARLARDYMFDVYNELINYKSLGGLCEEFFCVRLYPSYEVRGNDGIAMAGVALVYIVRKRL